MRANLESARAFFRRSPFMVDLGVDPLAVGEGTMSTALVVATRHLQHRPGARRRWPRWPTTRWGPPRRPWRPKAAGR
ncbi:MAG: hypothetical protein U1F50_11905 [Rubrivivax sp.]